ncbi:hypothetical protein J4209_00800 [Candidatus Woesearchaeota archaeon]|nr:hypothetical protein [Candidatus Woesearchaeota archaeon]
MHFYESSIITTKDGLHCQVYGNEHPVEGILIKPKYIPTDKIVNDDLPCRFISGKKMNRLNLWVGKESLKHYITEFKRQYPQYIYKSPLHSGERLFFIAPIDKIERVYFPRRGLSELMKMPEKSLDPHLKACYEFVNFLLESGLKLNDLGITYSTLMGHYFSNKSDINIVVYGKKNFWKLMDYLKTVKHPLLRWKTKEEWLEFHKRRNRFKIFEKEQFLMDMMKRKSEGFFNGTLFVIFAAEKEDEVWSKWGEEKYAALGLVTAEGIIIDNFSSVVRPGCYEIKDSKIIKGRDNIKVNKIVFYSRDYCMLADPGEKIQACGVLEKVEPKNKDSYYRVVVGYFDAYISDRRENEYIRVVKK